MKSKIIIFIILSVLFGTSIFAQSNGDYRTNPSGFGGTGDWNNAGDWEMYDGLSWGAAGVAPNSTTATVTILANHSMNLNTSASVNNLVIEANAELRNASTTLRGLYIYGTLDVDGKFGDASDKIAIALSGTTASDITGSGTIDLDYIFKSDATTRTVTITDATVNLYKSTNAIYQQGSAVFNLTMTGGVLNLKNGTLGEINA